SEEHTSELQSLTNLVCRLLLEKHQHPIVSGADFQNFTNPGRIEVFDLFQYKRRPLVHRQPLHASVNDLAELFRQHQTIQISRRTHPHASCIESSFKYRVYRVGCLLADQCPTTLQRFSVQDSEEPRAKLRPPLEAVDPF